jgi:hypothetical protein
MSWWLVSRIFMDDGWGRGEANVVKWGPARTARVGFRGGMEWRGTTDPYGMTNKKVQGRERALRQVGDLVRN